MNENKEWQVKALNSSFYRGELDFVGLLPPCDEYPMLHKILSEYSMLIKQSNISEQDADRISAILELAEQDKILDECIDKIDKASQVQSEILCTKLSIEDFLIELVQLSKKQAANKDAFMESFAELVKRININTDLVDSVIEFNTAKYNSTDVVGSPRFCMYVNSWMPNQMTSVHQNFRYSTETLVYRGKVTKTVFKRISENGIKCDDIPIYHQEYGEGEWISTNSSEIHQLANFSLENLVTIHFKYFNIDPSDREIRGDNNLEVLSNHDQEPISKQNSIVKNYKKRTLDEFLEVIY